MLKLRKQAPLGATLAPFPGGEKPQLVSALAAGFGRRRARIRIFSLASIRGNALRLGALRKPLPEFPDCFSLPFVLGKKRHAEPEPAASPRLRKACRAKRVGCPTWHQGCTGRFRIGLNRHKFATDTYRTTTDSLELPLENREWTANPLVCRSVEQGMTFFRYLRGGSN